MITSFEQLDPNGVYSYADYLTWKFDEQVEIIKGKLFKMSPAPRTKHQVISANLTGIFWNYLNNKPCQLFHAPFDVRLSGSKKSDKEVYTVVQPDLCIICDLVKIDEKGCVGAPDLIVEIVSNSTKKRDLNEKFKLYEENGVKEYWIVLPEEQIVEVFDSEIDTFKFRKNYTENDLIPVGIFPHFFIDFNTIF